jgi:glycosyltransferase involved in cell wall biosynthesis
VPRLLYFSRDYTPHDHRFLTALAKTDYEIYYLRLERRGHQTEERSLPVEIVQIPWSGGRGLVGIRQGLGLLPALRKVIWQVKPDLIQAGPIQRSAFLVALTGFRPLVSMSWGYDLLMDANRNTRWRWATRFTLRRSAAMVGDCNTIRKRAISYGMPDERIVTFPWGVDIHHFMPQPVSVERPTFNLLSTRGWEPIYGVDLIAQAFIKVAKHRPDLHLIMLGNGSLATALYQTFSRGGVEERVIFPGQVKYADLPRYYHMADLYVSASHSDGSSISLLEAMACGRPALVSDILGNREWVTPNENGWLFSDGDVDALARSILHILESRDRLPEMGRAARQITEARADWEKNFPRLLEAYRIAFNIQR